MPSVFDIIRENITEKRDTSFVFPSETTASLWARKICFHGIVRSLSPERFLAWDRFKEEAIHTKEKNRRPVSSLIRHLFALSLTKKNAAAPFLKAIIPPEYAENSGVFANSIAGILSSLRRWEKLHEAGHIRNDDEDHDLYVIKTGYAAFLQENNLFEPSWEKMQFREKEKNYIVFFPEALSDFDEYRELLESPQITLYSCADFSLCAKEKPALVFFDSARKEIRTAVLELRRLHKEGLSYEEVAITLPDFKNMAPYVERELALYDIPFTTRSGRCLGEYPIGRLFSLIGECSASLFSFDAVKRLVLDIGIPWKDMEKNRALIAYGIENHCAAPFRDRSRTADAWEEGFKQNPDENLSAYYRELKKSITGITGAATFREIMEQYHVFRSFLDMEQCSAESDAVLARCIEELSVLTETEETLPGLTPGAPFNFYVSHLKEKNYVYIRNTGGVNLYDYPVAAGTPYGCHFLLNASQASVSVQYRPLPFLRQDKRAKLGIGDTDASAAMLSLFTIAAWKDYSCHTRISASEKTFSGWAIPHSFFIMNQEKTVTEADKAADTEDLYNAEQRWRALSSAGETGSSVKKPEQLHSIQKEGFKQWSAFLPESPSDKSRPYTEKTEALLQDRIRSKNLNPDRDGDAELSVSATDLNDFFTCPVSWLYRRIFRLEKFTLDASLLDAESLGIIYHRILERLFEHIKKSDLCFLKKNLGVYYNWLEEITPSVLRSSDTLRGPLVYPLFVPLARSINRKLRAYLKTEALYFDQRKIMELERSYKVYQGTLLLNGKIDRVSEGPVIIDYKSGSVPKKSHSRWSIKDGLLNFQMPMYIKLYEEVTGEKVKNALFADIKKNGFVSVVGAFRKEYFSRDDYQITIDDLDRAIEEFKESTSRLDFTRKAQTCASCNYKTMCRTFYTLNHPADLCSANFQVDEEDVYEY